MNTLTNAQAHDTDEVRAMVRFHYSRIVESDGCGCAPSCCNPGTPAREAAEASQQVGYTAAQVAAVPEGANLGLGCGNPLAIASLRPGQAVLDLGSGAGFDAFLAADAVGPTGRVIGVDMTPSMVSKARGNATKADRAAVEFRLGEIENLPVADASIDVIISNCVINLSPDKARVFAEAARVLKPGGRLAISDVVALQPVPERLLGEMSLYAGCATGSAMQDDLRALLAEAGFIDIHITPKADGGAVVRNRFPGQGLDEFFASAIVEAVKPAAAS